MIDWCGTLYALKFWFKVFGIFLIFCSVLMFGAAADFVVGYSTARRWSWIRLFELTAKVILIGARAFDANCNCGYF